MIDSNNKLFYRDKPTKYQIIHDYVDPDYGLMGFDVETDYLKLTPDGILTCKALYSWDGASGLTHDDYMNMVPALEHDEIYEAIRMGVLPLSVKEYADDKLRDGMLERGLYGMEPGSLKYEIEKDFIVARAKMYHDGVDLLGGGSCKPDTDNRDIKEAF